MAEEDPALYLAGRIVSVFDLDVPADWDAMLWVTRNHGVEVRLADITTPGLCVTWPRPVILLRDRSPEVLSHELFHVIAEENLSHGIDYGDHDLEQSARRFAALLTGGEMFSVRLGPDHPPPAWLVVRSARRVSGFRGATVRNSRMALRFTHEHDAHIFAAGWRSHGIAAELDGLTVLIAIQ